MIPLVKPINRKPKYGSRIDWSNPITRTLKYDFLLNEGGGKTVYDAVSKKSTGTFTGTGNILWQGEGIDIPSGTDASIHHTGVVLDSTRFTSGSLAIWFKLLGPWSSQPVGQFLWDNGAPRFFINIDANRFFRLFTGDTDRGVFDPAAFILPGLNFLVFTWPTNQMYLNGNLAYSYSSGAFGNSITEFVLGDRYETFGNSSFYGKIVRYSFYNSELSSSSIISLYINPYQFIKSPLSAWVFGGGAAGPTTYSQSVSGGMVPASIITRRIYPHLTGGVSSSGLKQNRTFKSFSGGFINSGLETRRTYKNVLAGVTSSGLELRQTGKKILGGMTDSGTIIRSVGHIIIGGLTSSGLIIKSISHAIAGGLTGVGNIIKNVGHSILAGLTSSGNLATLKAFFITLTGGLTSSAIIVRNISHNVLAGLSSSATTIRSISKNILAGLTSSGLLQYTTSAIQIFYKTITSGLTFSGTVAKNWLQVLYKLYYIMKK